MARKITEDACRAFHNGYDFKKSNTEVGRYYESGGDDFGWCMWLHNNGIAKRMNGRLYIRSAGWRTCRLQLHVVQFVERDYMSYETLSIQYTLPLQRMSVQLSLTLMSPMWG